MYNVHFMRYFALLENQFSSPLKLFVVERCRRRLFPFRKQAMPFLTVDAIIGNQAFSIADVIVCSGLCCNKVISNFFKSS